MTATTTVTNRLTTRMAIIAVTLMFAVNGVVIGGYAGSLPSLRAKLDLDATQIAIILFCAGAAAILAMQIGGRLADSIGAREITLAAVPFLIAGMITIGLASAFGVAIVGGILLGLGNGAMDVAMNAIGVQVEAARRRPIMSFFHAFWSIGNWCWCCVAARHAPRLAGRRDRDTTGDLDCRFDAHRARHPAQDHA
jgi:MFS family permease